MHRKNNVKTPGKQRPEFKVSVGLYRKFFTDQLNKNIHLFPISQLVAPALENSRVRQEDPVGNAASTSSEQLTDQLNIAKVTHSTYVSQIKELKQTLENAAFECDNDTIRNIMNSLNKDIEDTLSLQASTIKLLDNNAFFLSELDPSEIKEDIETYQGLIDQIKTLDTAGRTILEMVTTKNDQVRTGNTL